MKIFLVIRIFVISLYSDSGMNLTHRGGSRIGYEKDNNNKDCKNDCNDFKGNKKY